MEKKIENKNMIELIYKAEEEILDKKIKQINKKIKDEIKDIDTNKLLNMTSKEEVSKILSIIEDNYSIKINSYIKEFYKQGFIDGVNLMINCLLK